MLWKNSINVEVNKRGIIMLQRIWEKLKEMLKKLITANTIEEAIDVKPIISNEMSEAIELWGEMYQNQAPWLQDGDATNGYVTIVSLNLPAQISSEKARMAVLEMGVEITSTQGESKEVKSDNVDTADKTKENRIDILNKEFSKVLKKIRNELEYGIATGGLVIKPYIVTNNDDLSIEFDFIHADGFYPLAFNGSGKVTEAAFVQTLADKEYVYTRIEHHKLENDKVIVQNRAFKAEISNNNYQNGELGDEISLGSVSEWAELEPEQEITGVDRLLFAYFKMPEANTIDTHSPLGVSGFSRAVDLIEEADKQYSRILWEYEATECALDIDRDTLRTETDSEGNEYSILPKMQQRLTRERDVEGLYQIFSPTIRDNSLFNGLNQLLMRIEDVCQISRGTLSEVTTEARTATELKILKQRSYSANKDIQDALKYALEDTIYIMNVYITLYQMATDNTEYEVSFDFDDSLLIDKDAELNKWISLMQNGLMSDVEVRMRYFGETEEQAQEAINKIKGITDDNREESGEETPTDTEPAEET